MSGDNKVPVVSHECMDRPTKRARLQHVSSIASTTDGSTSSDDTSDDANDDLSDFLDVFDEAFDDSVLKLLPQDEAGEIVVSEENFLVAP